VFITLLLIGIAVGVGTMISYLGKIEKQNKRIIELLEEKQHGRSD
jgi:sensor histidine kinase YesM